MQDLDALLAAVLANQDEDTVRLVYADALEETGESANVTRAEFIRIQCEAARTPHERPRRHREWVSTNRLCVASGSFEVPCSRQCARCRLDAQSQAILQTVPPWAEAPCPMKDTDGSVTCELCGGSGNLLWGDDGNGRQLLPYTFRRGFLDSVGTQWSSVFDVQEELVESEVRRSGIRGMPGLRTYLRVSSWARELVRCAPTLRMVVCREYFPMWRQVHEVQTRPFFEDSRKEEWLWTRGFWRRRGERPVITTATNVAADIEPDVPADIFDLMKGGRLIQLGQPDTTTPQLLALTFRNGCDAESSLATAVCDFVRHGFSAKTEVGGEVETRVG